MTHPLVDPDSNLTATPIIEPIVRLWTLRFLVDLELHRRLIKPRGWASDLIVRALALPKLQAVQPANTKKGLPETTDDSSSEEGDDEDATIAGLFGDGDDAPPRAGKGFDMDAATQLLRDRHAAEEANARHATPPAIVAANMARLRELVGLSDLETRILTFAVMVHTDQVLDLMSDWVGDLTSARLFHAVSAVLAIPEKEVRQALSPQGTLARSGLLTVDRKQRWALATKLDLLCDGFADTVVSDNIDALELLRGMVTFAPMPTLTLEDFAHVDDEIELMRGYLERVLLARRHGVNILVHGAPGTGKTELTRALAHSLQVKLYEVTGEDTDGDAVMGEQRLRAFRAAQAFFAETPALIVFDEAEDVFADTGPHERSVAQARKAWINRALESNPVPTLWLSNSVTGLDPAFMRRFDMVLRMRVPPARVRKRIILEACAHRLPDTTVQRMSTHGALTPGVVARAASVLQQVADDWAPQRFGEALERLVSGTLEAQGHAPLAPPVALPTTGDYDLRYLNVDCDLAALAQGVVRTRSARLCLYGPSGTGKSAFAAWLAERLECPLLLQRASDMIAPFVGETEQNIARVFREALHERAVLLIDEADSFLRDRAFGGHSWEITAVNEMLTQVEHFNGVLVMSTNLFDTLDAAALRRFDAKLHFGYLRAEQAGAFFAERCTALGLGTPGLEDQSLVARLGALTPGDFAAVIRRHGLSPMRSAAGFARALADECRTRQRGKAPIGFS
jgi:SpoVK/Ycf46/Vps4 family AAA+-type ATPase